MHPSVVGGSRRVYADGQVERVPGERGRGAVKLVAVGVVAQAAGNLGIRQNAGQEKHNVGAFIRTNPTQEFLSLAP